MLIINVLRCIQNNKINTGTLMQLYLGLFVQTDSCGQSDCEEADVLVGTKKHTNGHL